MGLIKNIEMENGIVLNYHRIGGINKITNEGNVLQVISYINKEQRQKEKNDEKNIYTEVVFIPVPYDDNMTIVDAYNILKTKDMFENAQDDLEV